MKQVVVPDWLLPESEHKEKSDLCKREVGANVVFLNDQQIATTLTSSCKTMSLLL